MSDTTNDKLIDEGLDWAETWEGTMHADIIRHNISSGDMEGLAEAINRARTDFMEDEARQETWPNLGELGMLGERAGETMQERADEIRHAKLEDGEVF